MSWWRHVGVTFYDGFVEVFQKVALSRNLGWEDLILSLETLAYLLLISAPQS